jgi:hypothetical protein
MPRPTASPIFSTLAGTRTQPAVTTVSQGYQPGSPLPARHANWLWGTLGDWTDWFRSPADVELNLHAWDIGQWRISSVEAAQILSGPLVARRGLQPTAGVVIGNAAQPLRIQRVVGGGEWRLKELRLNYRWQGAGSSITVALSRFDPDPTITLAQTQVASATIPTESSTLAPFVWAADEVIDPASGYGIGITMDRTNIAHVLEVYDVRAVFGRPAGEG